MDSIKVNNDLSQMILCIPVDVVNVAKFKCTLEIVTNTHSKNIVRLVVIEFDILIQCIISSISMGGNLYN